MTSEQIPNRVLLFDGVCNLCNGAVQFIIKRDPDGLISFTSLQSETGQSLLKKSGLPTDRFDSFVFIEDR
ncbi:thiol-disulfide oxidoreductase DCC family protein, partial [Bacillus subtilis]|uniref:thiol-disulfide oxidoreductase DCC family protein n=3 Tax=Bacillus TaxID=1386 RepID=UPI0004A78CFB